MDSSLLACSSRWPEWMLLACRVDCLCLVPAEEWQPKWSSSQMREHQPAMWGKFLLPPLRARAGYVRFEVKQINLGHLTCGSLHFVCLIDHSSPQWHVIFSVSRAPK